MGRRDEEKWNKVIGFYEEGYTKAQIARMMGVKRQRITTMINKHECENGKKPSRSKLTSFQKRKIEEILYPNIRDYLLENNITLGDFCMTVGDNLSPYFSIGSLLVGKSNKTSIGSIKNIIKETGLSFDDAFRTEEDNEADCVE